MPVTVTRRGAAEHATSEIHPALRDALTRAPIGQAQSWTGPFGGWLEPPRPAVKLIIDLEGAVTADGCALPSAWMGGIGAGPTLVGVEGTSYASVDLELTPLGAFSVMGGRPLDELHGNSLALEDLFGRRGRELAERVRDARGWHRRLELAQAFLADRAAGGVRPTPSVARAWHLLARSGGRMRVEAVAAELGVSRRHLAATFRRETGLTPKAAARLLRFTSVRAQIETHPERWADVAHAAGYADQSHFNREFRQFTGLAPSAFLGRRLAEGGYAGTDLPYVQDVGPQAA